MPCGTRYGLCRRMRSTRSSSARRALVAWGLLGLLRRGHGGGIYRCGWAGSGWASGWARRVIRTSVAQPHCPFLRACLVAGASGGSETQGVVVQYRTRRGRATSAGHGGASNLQYIQLHRGIGSSDSTYRRTPRVRAPAPPELWHAPPPAPTGRGPRAVQQSHTPRAERSIDQAQAICSISPYVASTQHGTQASLSGLERRSGATGAFWP
jgi:hypothetical protein